MIRKSGGVSLSFCPIYGFELKRSLRIGMGLHQSLVQHANYGLDLVCLMEHEEEERDKTDN